MRDSKYYFDAKSCTFAKVLVSFGWYLVAVVGSIDLRPDVTAFADLFRESVWPQSQALVHQLAYA